MRIVLAAALLGGVLAASAGAESVSGGATLKVTLRVRNCCYREGAIYYVALARGRRTAATAHRSSSGVLVLRVKPARYRLSSWARPCEGNCGGLDPPTDRCARQVALQRGTRKVVIVSTARSPCRIRFL
jgi:hypothetical protein